MTPTMLASTVEQVAPTGLAAVPFAALLLSIAILPLIRRTEHFWHTNRNKLLVAAGFAAITLVYYLLRGRGLHVEGHVTAAGVPTLLAVLRDSILGEYIPFMVLLFSLYTISGGIVLRGDLRATPTVNLSFLGAGALLASLVGTTGASMLLIRPLLQTNREREYVRHTVIFFIFLVSNIGGCLLPFGDPPLFLGYLRGVPFLWTLQLWKEWALCTGILLTVYFIWDSRRYAQEPSLDRLLDKTQIEPLRIQGQLNFLWLLGVLLAVAFINPGQPLVGTSFVVPEFLREGVMLLFVTFAWWTTPPTNRESNSFDFGAIIEVAVLFVGIFVTMQPPIEILHVKGPHLGLHSPAHFFWAAGGLSSFLDNAPTYVVFFETAKAMTATAGEGVLKLLSGEYIREDLLVAVSLGSVFMGANTYIGNGPNFMVKSIAEGSGVRMPSFFGYMAYSICILIPVFIVVILLL